jgi:hypothetical protein
MNVYKLILTCWARYGLDDMDENQAQTRLSM